MVAKDEDSDNLFHRSDYLDNLAQILAGPTKFWIFGWAHPCPRKIMVSSYDGIILGLRKGQTAVKAEMHRRILCLRTMSVDELADYICSKQGRRGNRSRRNIEFQTIFGNYRLLPPY